MNKLRYYSVQAGWAIIIFYYGCKNINDYFDELSLKVSIPSLATLTFVGLVPVPMVILAAGALAL